jgi:hypothetical protein
MSPSLLVTGSLPRKTYPCPLLQFAPEAYLASKAEDTVLPAGTMLQRRCGNGDASQMRIVGQAVERMTQHQVVTPSQRYDPIPVAAERLALRRQE